MNQFQPGQRVRCVEESGSSKGPKYGEVYTVDVMAPNRLSRLDEGPYVYLKEIPHGWYPDRFEPYTEPPKIEAYIGDPTETPESDSDGLSVGEWATTPADPSEAVETDSEQPETVVYVSGPMTGYEDYNFPAFNDATELLKLAGYTVVNPAEKGIVEDWDWADYLRYDLSEIVDRCNAFYTLPGWQESKGATLEVHVMQALGMKWLNPENKEATNTIQGPGARKSATAGVLPGEPAELEESGRNMEKGDPKGSPEAETPTGVRRHVRAVRSDVSESGRSMCDVSPTGERSEANESSGGSRPRVLPGESELREVRSGTSMLTMQSPSGTSAGRRESPDGNGYISISVTGGEKQAKSEAYDLIPWDAMDHVARVYAFGAQKYADHNWRKGYDWSLSIASAFRHMAAFAMGEDYDPESGELHPAHAVFHMLALLAWSGDPRFAEFDNRYKLNG